AQSRLRCALLSNPNSLTKLSTEWGVAQNTKLAAKRQPSRPPSGSNGQLAGFVVARCETFVKGELDASKNSEFGKCWMQRIDEVVVLGRHQRRWHPHNCAPSCVQPIVSQLLQSARGGMLAPISREVFQLNLSN